MYDTLDRTRQITLPDLSSTAMDYSLAEAPVSAADPDIGGGLRLLTSVTDAKGNQRESYRDVRLDNIDTHP